MTENKHYHDDNKEIFETGAEVAKRSLGHVAVPETYRDLTPRINNDILVEMGDINHKITRYDKYMTSESRDRLATDFLDIYFETQEKLDKGREITDQERLDEIATTNIFSRAFKHIFSGIDANKREHEVHELGQAILGKIDDRTGSIHQHSSNEEWFYGDEIEKIPEVVAFQMLMKGVRFEIAATDCLEELVEKGALAAVRSASLVEDVEKGFDVLVTDKKGQDFKIDIKSHNSYERILGKPDFIDEIDTGLLMKRGHDGDTVLAIDVDTHGFNGHMQTNKETGETYYRKHDTHKFELTNKQDFLDALRIGIGAMRVSTETSQRHLKAA